MATGIEWTDQVWNPVRGCSMVSPGCTNCYAMKFAGRFSGKGQPYNGLVGWNSKGPRWNGEIVLVPAKLDDPLHWRKPRRVFVNSMSDLFHDGVPDDYIRDIFAVMAEAGSHTFQVLTKRASRMEQWFGSWAGSQAADYATEIGVEWPLPNVWLGVSVENQDFVHERIPALLSTPARIRFVSAEPLLGPIDLECVECPVYHTDPDDELEPDCSLCMSVPEEIQPSCRDGAFSALDAGIHWVIVGCESGPKKHVRPMDESWVRDLQRQCSTSGTAFFYKQAKDERGKVVSLPLLDGKRWSEYPDEQRTRIQNGPKGARSF